MHYFKKFISTLATMSYYSNSTDQLDDHLTTTYLGLMSENDTDKRSKKSEEGESYAPNHLSSELLAGSVIAEMNNSYSSSQQNI